MSMAQTGSVSGRVLDSQTLEPLPFANVFINNTTIGAGTDAKGEFVFKDVPVGSSEIVYSFVGYQTYQSRINVIEGEELKLIIKLISQEQQLADVEVKSSRDKEWERQEKKFEKIFFGSTELAKECKITNPYVIDFPKDVNGKFIAKASAPINIQNMALGYYVTFYLKDFWSDGVHYSIIGNTKFEEIPPSNEVLTARWIKNRREAYLGSSRHLFYSLLEGRSVEEGFRFYTDRGNSTTARLSSFNEDLEKSTSVVTYKLDGIISQGNLPYEKRIMIKNRVEVHYLNKPGESDVYKDIGHAVSWLEAKNGFASVNNEGNILNSKELIVSGDMGSARVSNLLPLNYQPQHLVRSRSSLQIKADRLYETVYLHTNKSFFYPGDAIWFKGYMNYGIRGMADSLSSLLYVDFIDVNHKVVQSKILRIDSSRFSGYIKIPSELPNGNYTLMAYSNWMRNYGEQAYYTKLVPVLDIHDKPVSSTSTVAKNSQEVELTLDKEKYSTRSLVKAMLSLSDENDNPLKGNFSVSVTDLNQVPFLVWSKDDIRNEFIIPTETKLSNENFKYPVEHGITWNGEFQSGNKKKEPAKLTIVRENFEEVRKETTAVDGRITLKNLNIQDSVLYSFQALKGNNSYGKIVSLARDYPSTSFNAANYKIPIERKESVQHLSSSYEIPQEAILLTGIEIRSSKLSDPDATAQNFFGKGEGVISGEEISNYGSIEQLLRIKAPGFKLLHDGNHWLFLSNKPQNLGSGTVQRLTPRASKSTQGEGGMAQPSFANGDAPITTFEGTFPEPFLAIDNKQIIISAGETVGDRLMSLPVDQIERIEVSSLANSYIGANGSYGVIAVFMRKGTAPDKNKFQGIYIKGYNSFAEFKGPNYSNTSEDQSQGDFRSTLYWKNNLIVPSNGRSEFMFYTSDLHGQYRIVMEGITEKGKPIHYEQLFYVEP
jgi:hypothetical protein